MFSRIWTKKSTENYSEGIGRLAEAVKEADAVVIGAGSGLSASAGLTYSGERFEKYFGDFIAKYHIRDMYSGGFYPYPDLEEYWAWWSRHIYYNRYVDAPEPVYPNLYEVVKDKDYFVLTTNVETISSRKRDLIKSGCFIPRGIMGCGSVRSRAIRRRMIFTRYLSSRDIKYLPLNTGAMAVPYRKAVKKKVSGLSRDAVKTILAEPDTHSRTGLRDMTLMIVLYATAARIDELLSLKIGDIYFNSQKPYAVIAGKGGKIRTLYLLPKAVSFWNCI